VNLSLAACRAAWSSVFPGAAVALLVGMAAAFLGGHYKGSMLLFALLLGMALNFLTEDKRLAPGIQFVAGSVLRIGVALLGLRLTLENMSALGLPTVLALAIAVTATVLAGVVFAGMLGLERGLGLLAAVGLKTSLRDVASLGWRPVLLLVLLTLLLAMLAAAFLHTWH
jgi:uncharacterized membrane protein YadS